MKLTFQELVQTRPLSKQEAVLLNRKMVALERAGSGDNHAFKFATGDLVMDNLTGKVGKVFECYRQNGHNLYNIDKKLAGGVREMDLTLYREVSNG